MRKGFVLYCLQTPELSENIELRAHVLLSTPNFFNQNSLIDLSRIKIHKETLLHALEIDRLRVAKNEPWQNKRISRSYVEFWMECATFYITAMASWASCGDHEKYHEASHNARACLHYVRQLIMQVTEEHRDDRWS